MMMMMLRLSCLQLAGVLLIVAGSRYELACHLLITTAYILILMILHCLSILGRS